MAMAFSVGALNIFFTRGLPRFSEGSGRTALSLGDFPGLLLVKMALPLGDYDPQSLKSLKTALTLGDYMYPSLYEGSKDNMTSLSLLVPTIGHAG